MPLQRQLKELLKELLPLHLIKRLMLLVRWLKQTQNSLEISPVVWPLVTQDKLLI
jgi:hypothetical protein